MSLHEQIWGSEDEDEARPILVLGINRGPLSAARCSILPPYAADQFRIEHLFDTSDADPGR